HVVEAAAMHLPGLAVRPFWPAGRRLEAEIEVDEIERAADPGDAGDDVQPAQAGAQRFCKDDVHPLWSRRLRPRKESRCSPIVARMGTERLGAAVDELPCGPGTGADAACHGALRRED